jgi:hypothetical protein
MLPSFVVVENNDTPFLATHGNSLHGHGNAEVEQDVKKGPPKTTRPPMSIFPPEPRKIRHQPLTRTFLCVPKFF